MINERLANLYRRYCRLITWNIGVASVSPAQLRELVDHGRLQGVRWCPRRSALTSRADPFVWPLEDGARVIYEEIDHWSERGHIRSLTLNGFLEPQPPRMEIEKPFHLSYPFVLSHEGAWYCAPESARADGVDLYAWSAATQSWQLQRRLLDGVAILDATLFRHAGVWYLLGTVRGPGSYDTLRIWWSETLEGEWRKHGQDPAKVSLASARPAGPLFELDGHWYRPAQDCTGGYGSALAINRLDVLTPTQFAETTVSMLKPDPLGPYPHGLHTLAVFGDKVLIDGKRVGFSTALPLMKLARALSRKVMP